MRAIFLLCYQCYRRKSSEARFSASLRTNETLQNIHPLEDGSGQARLPGSFTPWNSPMGSPLSFVVRVGSPVFLVPSGLIKVYNTFLLLKIEDFTKNPRRFLRKPAHFQFIPETGREKERLLHYCFLLPTFISSSMRGSSSHEKSKVLAYRST